MLANAMVLATFSDMRATLTHVSSCYAGLDMEFLFGAGVNRDMVNEYNLGAMLDRLSEQDCNALYREGKNASHYESVAFTEELYGYPTRLLGTYKGQQVPKTGYYEIDICRSKHSELWIKPFRVRQQAP